MLDRQYRKKAVSNAAKFTCRWLQNSPFVCAVTVFALPRLHETLKLSHSKSAPGSHVILVGGKGRASHHWPPERRERSTQHLSGRVRPGRRTQSRAPAGGIVQ